MRALWLSFVFLCAACACKPAPISSLTEEPVRVSASRLDFGPTFLGYPSSQKVDVTNPNRFSVALSVAVPAPFHLAQRPTRLEAAGAIQLELAFSPIEPGSASATLSINDGGVLLTGTGLATPSCDAGSPCRASTFDPDAGRCVEAPVAEGAQDGPAALATFGNIRGLALDPTGNLYLADLNRVRRYSPTLGTVTTVFELSDAPTAIAYEPGGTLLVTVPSAILRLKP